MTDGTTITGVLVAGAAWADEGLVRAGVQLAARAATAGDAARLVVRHRPRLAVADLDSTPTALAAVERICAAAPEIPVLALTAVPDHVTVLAAVRAGATSVLVTGTAAELADAVHRTAAGEAVFSPGLADVVLEEFGHPTNPWEDAQRLTEREADVLRLVVEGLTARQIAARLVLSPRTVENHVQHMLRKLQLSGRAALVRYAIEHGMA